MMSLPWPDGPHGCMAAHTSSSSSSPQTRLLEAPRSLPSRNPASTQLKSGRSAVRRSRGLVQHEDYQSTLRLLARTITTTAGRGRVDHARPRRGYDTPLNVENGTTPIHRLRTSGCVATPDLKDLDARLKRARISTPRHTSHRVL